MLHLGSNHFLINSWLCLTIIPRVRTSDALFQIIFDIIADDFPKIRVMLKPGVKETLAYH